MVRGREAGRESPPVPPFRWDLVTPDQLGSLLDGVEEPDLWFLDDLVACAGKVLARGGDARLVFVGRSLDSMFDLLSGAIPDRVTRLPLSLAGFSEAHTPRAREVLTEHGITPSALAREAVTFVDVVSLGSTFSRLFTLFDNWIVETREPWGVIRRHLRFVGVTWATKTSPNTWRWQQHADWTGHLPAVGRERLDAEFRVEPPRQRAAQADEVVPPVGLVRRRRRSRSRQAHPAGARRSVRADHQRRTGSAGGLLRSLVAGLVR